MKIIFAGTPNFAATILTGLLANNLPIAACYSQPDRHTGRGQHLAATPVKTVALQNNIPVYQPINFKDANAINELRALQPDLIIVVAYGLILPQAVLDIPKYGCINIHGSILPKWRGASPVQYAILNGDSETGVSIIQMDKGMDTGDVLYTSKCAIDPQDTTESLLEKLATLSITATTTVVQQIQNHTTKSTPQAHELATYAHKINKHDGLIEWNQDAALILRKIKAFTPWPGCYFVIPTTQMQVKIIAATAADADYYASTKYKSDTTPGTILEITKAGVAITSSDGVILITQLQFPGSKILAAADVVNTNKYRDILMYGNK